MSLSVLFYSEEKDRFVWFHHTWKHEKLTNAYDKISLINSTKMNIAFAHVSYVLEGIEY